MKVAIFSPYSLPELGANSLRVDSFRKFFTKAGLEVRVYSPKRDGVKTLPAGYFRYEKLSDIYTIVSREKFDIVIGTSPPMTHSFVALFCAKLFGAKAIADIRDPWIYSHLKLGIYSAANPKVWVYRAIELLTYNISDRIFAVTDFTKKLVQKDMIDGSKVDAIYNGTDTVLFRPDAKKGKQARTELGILQDAKVCIYAGAFVKKDVDVMITHIAPILRKKKANLLLVIPIGKWEVEEFANLSKIIKDSGLESLTRVVNSKEFGFENLYKYYSAADIGLDPLPNGMDDYCIPVKTYDLLACSVPIVAKSRKGGELANLIAKHKVGWSADSWSGFCSMLQAALSEKNTKDMKNRARNAAENVFERSISNRKALGIIENLTRIKNG